MFTIALAVSRVEPALPSVDRALLHLGTVQRGEMVREVRGSGTLVPEQIRFVQAESDGRVERMLVQPGAQVRSDTVLMELSNPELEQAAFDAEWQLESAGAELDRLRAQLVNERLTLQSAIVALGMEAAQAELDARTNEELAAQGLISASETERSRARAGGLGERLAFERQRLVTTEHSGEAHLAVQRAAVERARAWLERKRQQVAALRVRAGTDGVLQQTGDASPLQVGQRVTPGATLAKIVDPTRLRALLKVAETQAQDLQLGQPASIDTRHGTVPGRVARIDPAAQNGTVTVEVELEGRLPKGARPESSVDGVIELERLVAVLYVGRPAQGAADATVGLFRVTDGGDVAERVSVELGAGSVHVIEVRRGLEAGDQVILSDMAAWGDHERIRLNGG
jgi:HlyD family secretion protein